MKTYKLITKKLPRRARSERRRETLQGAGGTVTINSGGSESTADPMRHTHENKYYLDQITTDADDYLYLTQRHGEDQHIEKNKVKAGHADVAADLAPDAPARMEFLSRLKDDTAEGKITFRQMVKMLQDLVTRGVYSGDAEGGKTFVPGGYTGKGFGIYTDADGNACIEGDNIVARRKFEVNILEIQKQLYAAGNINLTEANGTVAMVQLMPQGYKLFFKAEDEAATVADMWHNGDMALMQTLNVTRGQRAYHRVVTAHGTEMNGGKKYNYIVVSNVTASISVKAEDGMIVNGVMGCDTTLPNSTPAEGDKVIQCGSVTESERMGLTRIDSRGNGYGGIYVYEGIGKRIGTPLQFKAAAQPIVITPQQIHVAADDISLVTRNAHGEINGASDVGEMISSIDMKTDSIKLKVGLDGGRNLLKGTKNLDGGNIVLAPDSMSSAVYKDFVTAGRPLTGGNHVDIITYNNLELAPSTVYVLSFMYLSNPGTSFETYIYNPQKPDMRVCEYVKNNQTNEKTMEVDGHSHFDVQGNDWTLGTVEFKTTADVKESTKVTVIVGRLKAITGKVNFGNFCAPKIEYGAEATQWRPSDDDSVTDANLLDTGIDIEHRKITLTSDKVVVQNNKGKQTAMLDADGKITTQLINAEEVVTNGLKTQLIEAEDAVMANINIMGNSRFGGFGVSAEMPWIMHNIDYEWTDADGVVHEWTDRDANLMTLSPDGLQFEYYIDKISNPQETPNRCCTFGSLGNTDYMVGLKEAADSPRLGKRSVQGIMIDIPETILENIGGNTPLNDALYIRHGTSTGIRFRTRHVNVTDNKNIIRLKWYDHTVIIDGGNAVQIWLPESGLIDDGQRIEIWCCAKVNNEIMCNGTMSDGTPVAYGHTKIYLYDKKNNKWWVRDI